MLNLNVLIKPSSGMCNIRCEYCFYKDETKKRDVENYGFMSEEALEQVIRKVLEEAEESCTIAYQGGEPTLRGLEFFQRSLEFQKRYNKKKLQIHNAIQTNGIGLSDEFLVFLKENHFLVGVSIDGNQFTHDFFRRDPGGNGTFEEVYRTVKKMQQMEIEFNILTVVHARTARQAGKIYNFFKQEGFLYQQYIPCLNPLGEENVRYPFTLTPKDYSIFLRNLFDLWYQDIKNGVYIHIQQLENYILLLHGRQPDICGMSGACSCQNVIEADGEVYPCDFYVLDRYQLGNLNRVSLEELNVRRHELRFLEESVQRDEGCKACKYFGICRGGCKRYREPAIDGVWQRNCFCQAYYEFFEYAFPRMEELARYYYRSR